MSHKWFPVFCVFCALLLCASIVLARGPMVSAMGNKHNLSAANTGVTYRAVDNADANPGGQQICIFCHTPHNALSQGPLWNRKETLIPSNFVRYSSSTLQINRGTLATTSGYDNAWQPNGSSRLCLSCHDGVTPLGGVVRKGGTNSGSDGNIEMLGGDTILSTSVTSFNPTDNPDKMKKGHHPVSFVYAASGFTYKDQGGSMIGLPVSDFTLPKNAAIPATPDMEKKVKLQDTKRDGRGWMQCTTCHDAHQNIGNDVELWPGFTRKMTPFWVYSGATAADGHDAVCNSCHKVSPTTTPDAWK